MVNQRNNPGFSVCHWSCNLYWVYIPRGHIWRNNKCWSYQCITYHC